LAKNDEFIIAYEGLNEGIHSFSFTIDNSFFETFKPTEIQNCNLTVLLTLNKRSSHLEITFLIKGDVELICDRCLENFTQPLSIEQTIYIKFGEEYQEEDVNLFVYPKNKTEIDTATIINELIVVSLPMRKVHPDDKSGNPTCKEEMLDYIDQLQVEGSEVDPRWNELKKMKNGTS
jgi:uncharacterized metal-binding protein YceD (DUF177 family)